MTEIPPALRTATGLVAALAVGWLGARILGEYPFTGAVPVIGGLLLGVAVVGAAGFVEKGDPPAWVIVVAAVIAVWAEWQAAWIDSGGSGLLADGGIGPLPDEAWWAMGAAGAGALTRLVPTPKRRGSDRAEPAPADED